MATKTKHRGLGRGLDALIHGGATRPGTVPKKKVAAKPSGKSKAPVSARPKAAGPADESGSVRMVGIHLVVKSPWQPRREFKPEALQELADSIRTKGVIQPVVLRPVGDRFELIAGERRFRASQAAGLSEIPALLREVSDLEAMEMALIENIQREDLNLIEEAEGYRALMAKAGLTQEEISRRVGKARATVANSLRLLDLSDTIRKALADEQLSAGHAKVLLGVEGANRELLATRVVAQGLSVRALEKLVAGLDSRGRGGRKKKPAAGGGVDPKTAKHLKFLSSRMQQELGTKVSLSPSRLLASGKREVGRIVIDFYDDDDLSRLLETLNLGDLLS